MICRTFLASLIGVMLFGRTVHAEFINTVPNWDTTTGYGYVGENNYFATFGQTITVGSDTFLSNFTFNIRNYSTNTAKYGAYVMEWSGVTNKAVGPVLYDSGLIAYSNNFYSALSINPNINLVSGKQYVLFLNSSNYFDGLEDRTALGVVNDSYAGGSFVALNNGTNFNALTTSTWVVGAGADFAFKATLSEFNAVPAPSGLLLSLFSIGCLAFCRTTRHPSQYALHKLMT